VKLDGGLGRAHTNPLAVVHVPAVLCVCTVSQGAQLTAAGRLVAMQVLCSTVVDAARNGGSGSQAHSSHVGGWPPSYSACWTPTTPTQPPHPLCNPPSTFLRGSWWKLAVRVPPMNVCQHVQARLTSTSPAYIPRRRMAIQHSGVLSAHPRTRGRMSARVMIPPNLHSPRCPAYHLSGQSRAIFDPRSRGGTTRRVLRSRVTPHQTPRITHVRW
jgi:hypothetical protein